MTEDYISRLRGPKVPYFLIEGETRLLDASSYPYGRNRLPVQCNFLEEKREPLSAHITGLRSIVFPFEGQWFKAKAIGIPSGASRPIFRDGRLLSYYLSQTTIGSGTLVWGFMSIEETKNEIHWMKRARELGLPVTEPVGIGVYEDIFVLEFKDRRGLFEHLNKVRLDDLLDDFSKNSKRTTVACSFCREPTDIRVDEILYAFAFPGAEKIFDADDSKDYLKWLGSSCGRNLRLHHDSGILHGTIPRAGGVMTNSHVANHLVGEEETWMTDYHMASQLRDKATRRMEVYCLSCVMNPLPYAQVIGRARFLPRKSPPLGLYEGLVLSPSEGIAGLGELAPMLPGAELAEAFTDGVERGYNRRSTFKIGPELKRNMLRRAVRMKEEMWRIYGIPKGMQRGVEYVRRTIASKKITEEELSEVAEALRD